MDRVTTNLNVLKPSRRPPSPGDILSFGQIHYRISSGAVIRTDARIGPIDGILIYIYRIGTAYREAVGTSRRFNETH
jgi:hypothetical protein